MTLALWAITVYAGQYVGEPLYCDTWETELVYSVEMPPWAAMPDWFWDAGGKCGDMVGIRIDGVTRYYAALDRVMSGDWYVTRPDGTLLPLGADLPACYAPFSGLSAAGMVWNETRLQAELTEGIWDWRNRSNVRP